MHFKRGKRGKAGKSGEKARLTVSKDLGRESLPREVFGNIVGPSRTHPRPQTPFSTQHALQATVLL